MIVWNGEITTGVVHPKLHHNTYPSDLFRQLLCYSSDVFRYFMLLSPRYFIRLFWLVDFVQVDFVQILIYLVFSPSPSTLIDEKNCYDQRN